MKYTFFKGLVSGLALVVSSFTNASLIEVDYEGIVGADTAITLDTSTGLEWLDLTVTLNRSYNDILSNLDSGGEFEGWRFATRTDVIKLWDSFGIAAPVTDSKESFAEKYEGALNFLDLIGNTRLERANTWNPFTDGFVLDTDGGLVSTFVVSVVCDTGPCLSGDITGKGATFDRGSHFLRSVAIEDFGSFLVRNTAEVPEPSTLAIFSLAMLGLASRKLKKKA